MYGPAAALAPLLPTAVVLLNRLAGLAVEARVAAAATAAAIPSKGENVVLLAHICWSSSAALSGAGGGGIGSGAGTVGLLAMRRWGSVT